MYLLLSIVGFLLHCNKWNGILINLSVCYIKVGGMICVRKNVILRQRMDGWILMHFGGVTWNWSLLYSSRIELNPFISVHRPIKLNVEIDNVYMKLKWTTHLKRVRERKKKTATSYLFNCNVSLLWNKNAYRIVIKNNQNNCHKSTEFIILLKWLLVEN